MIKPLQSNTILFLSTYPPVKCGIASFTQDLISAIDRESDKSIALSVCALNKKDAGETYESPVSMVMDSEQLGSCVEAAGLINQNPAIALVCIEHEFGLYGGTFGDYLLSFLELLEKPYVIRFHTVLPNPDARRLRIVRKIAALAARVIVMTKNSSRLLQEDYAVA